MSFNELLGDDASQPSEDSPEQQEESEPDEDMIDNFRAEQEEGGQQKLTSSVIGELGNKNTILSQNQIQSLSKANMSNSSNKVYQPRDIDPDDDDDMDDEEFRRQMMASQKSMQPEPQAVEETPPPEVNPLTGSTRPPMGKPPVATNPNLSQRSKAKP